MMTTSLQTHHKVVGYTRHYTNLKNAGANRTDLQEARIRKACAERCWSLLDIYGDTAPDAGKRNVPPRPRLRDAMNLALREGAILVVADEFRILRSMTEGAIPRGVPEFKIYLIKEGLFIRNSGLSSRLKIGQPLLDYRIRKYMAAQALLDLPRIPQPAAVASPRHDRAHRNEAIAKEIADAFEKTPSLATLGHRALADALNEQGIRSGGNQLWNAISIRDRRKRATEILLSRKQLETEINDFSTNPSLPMQSACAATTCASEKSTTTALSETVDQNEAGAGKFGDHRDSPTFGMF